MLNTLIKQKLAVAGLLLTFAVGALAETLNIEPAPNGIAFQQNYKNWKIFGVSHRTDKASLRIILANPIAYKAASEGRNNPWPDGSMFAKIAWKDGSHPNFTAATVPDGLTHVEFMIRDSKQFAATNGWGFARWLGMEPKPYGKDANFAQECSSCHEQAKDNGYVFTRKAPMP